MKKIPLTKGKFALVDDTDYEFLSQWKWEWRSTRHRGHSGYAIRRPTVDGKRIILRMHRVLLGVTDPQVEVDHVNGNGLDNRRSNIRACTRSQNQANQRKRGRFKGVYPSHNRKNKYLALVGVEGKSVYLGVFPTAIAAAKAYDKAAREYHGEFACLNFPK
jgi:hypothetical protein